MKTWFFTEDGKMYSMNNSKKNILLVGGAGYIGSHLANILLPYHSIFSTSRSAHKDHIELDFLRPETYANVSLGKKYDLIIVLASTLGGLGTTELKGEFLEANTKGLAVFLQFLSDHSLGERIIYISSMTVYGIENKIPVKETGMLEPLSTYGLSKKLAEQIFDFYCKSQKAKGVILRIPGVYGGNRKAGFIYNTAVKCSRNELVEMNTASLGYWETIHIEDLCRWMNEFISRYDWKEEVDIFNLSYGVSTDIIDCCLAIKKILRSSSEIKVTGEKGYSEFYLDNSRIKKYAGVSDIYNQSLEAYVKNISL
jgi:UDP-glucose 4-epimerase